MDSKKFDYLSEMAKKSNITLEKRQVCQFLTYYDLLIEWNEKINLTAITDFEEVCLKHFIDCLSIINCFNNQEELVNFFKCKSLIDVGTGAGFPGIPLKILVPDLKITLMDSLDKRIKFLNVVIDKLDLHDIEAVHGRVEDCATDLLYREQFDFATARAVASLPVLSEYCLPFVKVGGIFIAYKSEKAMDELSSSENALNLLGGKYIKENTFSLLDTNNSRTILFIEKEFITPEKYPRKAGKPVKKPL